MYLLIYPTHRVRLSVNFDLEHESPVDHDHCHVVAMRRSTCATLAGVDHDEILVAVNTVKSFDEGAAIVGGDVQQLVEECFEPGA